MSDPAKLNLALAEERAAEARLRLQATVSQVQVRLDPKVLAEDARQASLTAAKAGIDGARRHPGKVGGALALAGLVLGRHRIAALFSRRRKAPSPYHAPSEGTLP